MKFNFFNRPKNKKAEALSPEQQQKFWNKNTSPAHEEFKKEIIGGDEKELKGNFLKSETKDKLKINF